MVIKMNSVFQFSNNAADISLTKKLDGIINFQNDLEDHSDIISESKNPKYSKSQSKINILVLDDEELIQYVIGLTLTNFDCDFDIASTGKEALDLIQDTNKKYDLMFLDVWLPDMSGLEVCKLIRKEERYKSTPIFIASFQNKPKDLDLSSIGANGYYVKPFGSDQIEPILKAIREG
jgi:CheY-like chemotaxis protein